MKKQLLSSFLLCSSLVAMSQTFWTEGFSTGCNQGTSANGFAGLNGTWTTASTGTNDTYANAFYVSATEAFTGSGACGDGCVSNASQVNGTLHLSNVAIAIAGVSADNGATYFSGGACSAPFNICAITNTRAESPVIDCTGKTSITLGFDYMENGDGATDDASVWYYDGATWSLLSNTAKTAATCAGGQGLWTAFSIALPASADNNPNVKIGFNWTNNDDAVGTDPSFAVDNITLATPVSVGIAETTQALQVYSADGQILVKGSMDYTIIALHDILGRNIPYTKSGNSIRPEGQQGVYFLSMQVNGQVMTKKVFVR